MCDEITDILESKGGAGVFHKCDCDKDCPVDLSLGVNVCYIVCAVIINDNDEILLIQEAKASCRGAWYLPAGRVEPNETLLAAVKREVLEEAGFDFEPSGIICVEENGGRWIRFTFAGRVCGGSLKTLQDADAESLQAQWFNDNDNMQLRCRDILKVIRQAKEYYTSKKSNNQQRCLSMLPSIKVHKTLFLRSVVLLESASESTRLMLIQSDDGKRQQLPTICFQLQDSIVNSIRVMLSKYLADAFEETWLPQIAGLLGLEHAGESDCTGDGICFNVLVIINGVTLGSAVSENALPKLHKNAVWIDLKLNNMLLDLLKNPDRRKLCVPVISLLH